MIMAISKLLLMSYGHANGPPAFEPGSRQLIFSVRDIPNPPVQLRKGHTGLSARLRKEVMASKEAKTRFIDIENAIITAIQNSTSLHHEQHAPVAREEDQEQAQDAATTQQLLQVGICCEEGRHRSVSFVHELARSPALKQTRWEITCIHRDLELLPAGDENTGHQSNSVRKSRSGGRRKDSRRSGAFFQDG